MPSFVSGKLTFKTIAIGCMIPADGRETLLYRVPAFHFDPLIPVSLKGNPSLVRQDPAANAESPAVITLVQICRQHAEHPTPATACDNLFDGDHAAPPSSSCAVVES